MWNVNTPHATKSVCHWNGLHLTPHTKDWTAFKHQADSTREVNGWVSQSDLCRQLLPLGSWLVGKCCSAVCDASHTHTLIRAAAWCTSCVMLRVLTAWVAHYQMPLIWSCAACKVAAACFQAGHLNTSVCFLFFSYWSKRCLAVLVRASRFGENSALNGKITHMAKYSTQFQWMERPCQSDLHDLEIRNDNNG